MTTGTATTPDPQIGLSGGPSAPGMGTGKALAAEAATFAVASAVHFGTGFRDAAIPELVIATVLSLGSLAVLTRRTYARGAALASTAFAAFGTVVGLTIVAAGRRDVPDLSYHAAILAALAVTLVVLLRSQPDRRAGGLRPAEDLPVQD
jgi:hypothetical protein